jgi:hypothetical protein
MKVVENSKGLPVLAGHPIPLRESVGWNDCAPYPLDTACPDFGAWSRRRRLAGKAIWLWESVVDVHVDDEVVELLDLVVVVPNGFSVYLPSI